MNVNIEIPKDADRIRQYQALLPQLESLFSGEADLIANLANLSSVLHETFNFLWTGFYLHKEGELVLGPFQGPLACSRIKVGKGVCGTAFQRKECLIVPDVNAFPGHIACSPNSRSEIVVPLMDKNNCIGVLDIDSEKLNHFNRDDEVYLEKIIGLLFKYIR